MIGLLVLLPLLLTVLSTVRAANSLVISEIMFDPQGTNFTEEAQGWTKDDFTYIELWNSGTTSIVGLSGSFTKGSYPSKTKFRFQIQHYFPYNPKQGLCGDREKHFSIFIAVNKRTNHTHTTPKTKTTRHKSLSKK